MPIPARNHAAPLCLIESTLVILLFLPVSVMSAQSATQKVVTISFTDAVMHTNEAQRDFGVLQSKFAPREARLEALSNEIKGLQKVLGETGEKFDQAERNTRTEALAAKEKQLQRDEEDFRTDSQSEGQTAFQLVAKKVFDFLQDYAKQRGYSVVVERGTDASPIVWYAAGDADITDEVVSAYNAKSGVITPGPTDPAHPILNGPPIAPTPSQPHP
jgi:Outer membrane protein